MELTLSKSRTTVARSESALVAAARRGDDRAFEELYANYRQRIFAFIASKIRDHGRAEDIAQEVFISALRRLRASDQPISFKPWIYEIAKNACIDEFRRGSRSREVPLEPDENIGAGERPMMSLVPTPPAAIENKQRLDDLRGAFGGLSENHHQLLVLREFEGLTYDEIGDRLGMSRQMVESSLFRARRKLTAEYDELASGRRCDQIQTAIESGAAQSITSLGLRERRRFGRHLAHCQPCRHTARLAGVDEALLKPRSIAAKIAALLPFPLLRWPWGGGRGKGGAAAGSASRHGLAARTAARIAQPASSSVSLGPAAAAVAALAIAGAGAGLVAGLDQHQHSARPSSAVLAAESLKGSQQRTAATAAPVRSPAEDSAAKRANIAGALSLGTAGLGFAGTAPGSSTAKIPRHLSGGGKGTSNASGTHGKAGAPGSAGISPVSNAAGSIRSTLSGVTSTVRSTVSGVTKTVGSTVAGARGTVNSTVSGVKQTLGSAVSGVGHTVGQVTSPPTSGSAGASVGSAGNVGSTVGSVASKAGKTVGSISGSGSSSSSSLTSGAGPAAHSVTTPIKSVASGLLSK